MNIIKKPAEDLILLSADIYCDDRGFFYETFNKEKYNVIGINDNFIQSNISTSKKNVLRGLHYRMKRPQSQLLTIIDGEIFDVVVDIRRLSKTFLKSFSFNLKSDGTNNQIYMGKGFAHGFLVLSEKATLLYEVSEIYDANDDNGIFWNDPDLKIQWPNSEIKISEKDINNPLLSEVINSLK